MILSRFALSFDHPQARRDLASPYELHRTVKRLCGRESPLWRLEDNLVLMQSETIPAWTNLSPGYLERKPEERPFPIEDLRLEGRALRFRLRANPTVNRKGEVDGGRSARGQRHSIYDEAGQRAWLERQGLRSGFEVSAAEITESARRSFLRSQSEPMITIHPCTFEGRLRVIDPEAFGQALRRGIGSGKAFGMGLISVARG